MIKSVLFAAFFFCILLILTHVEAVAQSQNISLQEMSGAYDYSNFHGRPVIDLISAFEMDYRVAYLIPDYRSKLQGVAFVYTYNDSMDITLRVFVEDYKYITPSGKDRHFTIDDFMKESVSRVEAEQTARLSSDTEQLMLKLMEEVNSDHKEKSR